jgi:hypothetical protein
VFRTRLAKLNWLTNFSWPLFLVAILFIIPSLVIAWLSFIRQDYFQQHLENMDLSGYLLLTLCFCCYLLGWLLLIVIKPVINNCFLWSLAVIVFVASLVTVPLLSRDAASYALNADIVYHSHANPYIESVSLGRQSARLGSLWWLDSPSPYGPLFLLLLGLPFLLSFANLLLFIFSYKLLVLLAFGLTVYLFSRYRRQHNLPAYFDWLFLLNPALIINWLLEGHQEIFIVISLLWFLNYRHKFSSQLLILLSAGLIKITAVIIWPLSWFKNKIFNWQRFFIANLVFIFSWLLFFVLINLSPLNFWQKNLAFANQHCFYTCSPLIIVSDAIWSSQAGLVRLVLFIATYLISLYLFLFKKHQPLKFIVWSFMALFFINTKWLTPWYPTLIIPFSLLIKGRKYFYLTVLLTAYCLWHYLGL